MLARAMMTVATILCVSGWVCADTVILNTESDFSLAGQGVNGLQYGYYDSYQTTGTFLTTDMAPDPALMRWEGPGGDSTPAIDATTQHPLVDTSGTVINSAVRRYTFGSDSEPVFTER